MVTMQISIGMFLVFLNFIQKMGFNTMFENKYMDSMNNR